MKRQKERADDWRWKTTDSKKQLLVQEAELESLRLQIKGLGSQESRSSVYKLGNGVVLNGYKFLCSVMWLSVCLYKLGLSFRGVCEVLQFIKTFTGLNFAVPCHVTVRTWVQKMGLHLLKNGKKIVEKGLKKGEKWCVIVDESYSLGKSQLLVVLGVRLSQLKVGQSLGGKDVKVLAIKPIYGLLSAQSKCQSPFYEL